MDKYGLIGYPLGHSFSISYFNEKFQNENIDATYENFEIPTIEELPEILDSNPELKGLNVTIPYKEKVISYLDSLSPEAREIGAVNVIKVTHKNKKTILKGFNSDVIGFTQSIEPLLEHFHKKALILGTGGASKAIDFGLKSLGLKTLKVSRYEKPGTIEYSHITATSLPIPSRSIMLSSTALPAACILMLMSVLISHTMPWTTTRFSTTSSTILTRRCL